MSEKKNKPGRPGGSTENLRGGIMDAAEQLFSSLGYAGTTLREIADLANVTQGLINYYFGSKHNLFSQVFLRRGKKVSDRRIECLRTLEASDEINVENVVRAFLQPTLELRESENGRAFIRLQARLHTEPRDISYKLRGEAYTYSTKEFVRAFQKAVPGLTERSAYWRVTLMIGAYMYAFSDTHRLDELAPDVCDPDDSSEVLEEMVAFITAGFEAASVPEGLIPLNDGS